MKIKNGVLKVSEQKSLTLTIFLSQSSKIFTYFIKNWIRRLVLSRDMIFLDKNCLGNLDTKIIIMERNETFGNQK